MSLRAGGEVVQKIDHSIPDQDLADDDNCGGVADQQLQTSTELGADTLCDMTIVQEPYKVAGGPEIEIPIDSIMIDIGDLPVDIEISVK